MTEHKECVKYAPPESAYSLFDDPALQQAKAALTPEQREKYARAGEMMYDYDFVARAAPVFFKQRRASCHERVPWRKVVHEIWVHGKGFDGNCEHAIDSSDYRVLRY
jgi:hypothetical protein